MFLFVCVRVCVCESELVEPEQICWRMAETPAEEAGTAKGGHRKWRWTENKTE
jgi:hypothetical protein